MVDRYKKPVTKHAKNVKKIEKNAVEIEENDEEMEENDYEMEENEHENPLEETSDDEYDQLYQLKKKIVSAGLSTSEDLKFILKYKNEKGVWEHIKNYGDMPDIDDVGLNYGGGKYLLMVHKGEDYKFSKVFDISKKAYPPEKALSSKSDIASGSVSTSNPTMDLLMAKLMQDSKEAKESATKKETDMMSMMMNQMTNSQNMILALLSQKNNAPAVSPQDEAIKLITLMKSMQPDTPAFDMNKIIEMSQSMFQQGIQLATDIKGAEGEEGIGDVVKDMLKTFGKHFDPSMFGNKNKNLPANNTPASKNNTGQKQLSAQEQLIVVQEYFQMVKLAFDDKQSNDYFVSLACKSQKYLMIKLYAEKYDNQILLKFVTGAGFGSAFTDEKFKMFVFDLLDKIRRNGTISSEKDLSETSEELSESDEDDIYEEDDEYEYEDDDEDEEDEEDNSDEPEEESSDVAGDLKPEQEIKNDTGNVNGKSDTNTDDRKDQ